MTKPLFFILLIKAGIGFQSGNGSLICDVKLLVNYL